jgi:hypothetical protein
MPPLVFHGPLPIRARAVGSAGFPAICEPELLPTEALWLKSTKGAAEYLVVGELIGTAALPTGALSVGSTKGAAE